MRCVNARFHAMARGGLGGTDRTPDRRSRTYSAARRTRPHRLVFKNLEGRDLTLGDAIAGRPTLLLPADFTCTQICGPALSIAASALGQTGLEAGRDYSLVVVGIDARDGIEDARSDSPRARSAGPAYRS